MKPAHSLHERPAPSSSNHMHRHERPPSSSSNHMHRHERPAPSSSNHMHRHERPPSSSSNHMHRHERPPIVILGLDPRIALSAYWLPSSQSSLVRAPADPRVEPFNTHTSSRAAFETQKVRVSTRRKQARVTESTEQKRIWALRAVCGRTSWRHHSYLRALRDPRLFLCVGFLAFCMRPGCGRTPISLAPDRSPGRLPRPKTPSLRNRANNGPRMPGQIQNVRLTRAQARARREKAKLSTAE
jgi:hypothetical protein